ncbi:hypothetical protein [Streptomyces sp. NPDC087300]|uniref:hypothetical protein n=1 Tax=Streptomyces sp. NPDC087300 TaxID=3365780 RepID=UPI0038139CC6
MNAPDLAAMAAQALTAAASGAANTAASELVRDRLGRSARGRAALDAVAEAPDDPEASGSARAALADEIDADAEFAGRLAVLLHAPSHQYTGSVVMTGSKVTRSQIALGPVTINNTRTGRLALVTGVLLVVLVVGIAVYGAVRLFGTTDGDADDPPRGGSSASAGERSGAGGRTAALPPTTETVRRILPDRASMDTTEFPWAGAPEVRTSAAGLPLCRAAPACEKGATAAGAVEFGRGEDKGENKAEFLVLAFPDEATARLAYTDIVRDVEEADRGHNNFRKTELERRGEESQGLEGGGLDAERDPTPSFVNRALIFRQGAFIGLAHQLDDPTARRGTRILDLSAVLAERVAKADAGKNP